MDMGGFGRSVLPLSWFEVFEERYASWINAVESFLLNRVFGLEVGSDVVGRALKPAVVGEPAREDEEPCYEQQKQLFACFSFDGRGVDSCLLISD